ncbi:MAG: PatB family C-S lyase [Burkholderiales bacterium]
MPNGHFDFDTPVDRRGTSSSKWEKYAGRDVIPLWVADMDFRCAPAIVEALRARVEHGVFGYTNPPAELGPAVVSSLKADFDWEVDPQWIVWLPSLVVGLNVVSRAFAAEGEDILTAVPIYPPFLSAPQYADRNAVRVPLSETQGGWRWDFDALERAVTSNTRLLLLCSPHNPTGRVWSRDELQQLSAFARRHDLVVVSDEIHSGLLLDEDKTHLPFASLEEDAAQRSVTLLSASKTFNLPTLGCAFAIVPNAELRRKLTRTMAGIVHHVGGLGYVGTLAAYRDGKPWQVALVEYLRTNRNLVETAIAGMPGLRTWHVESTYLAWIDARELNTQQPAKFFEEAGVGLYDGALFGTPGFLRLNFACPRALLEQALERMRSAVDR